MLKAFKVAYSLIEEEMKTLKIIAPGDERKVCVGKGDRNYVKGWPSGGTCVQGPTLKLLDPT